MRHNSTEDAVDKGAQIQAAVRALLSKARIRKPPVDLEKLARIQGISSVRHAPMRSTLGTLSNRSGKLVVTLNSRERSRWRFTLAHEIGHTMVEPDERPRPQVVLELRKPRRRNAIERLCDEVAVELLLPRDLFSSAMADQVTVDEILRLSALFDASLQSTALRVGELAPLPVQVVCWERGRGGWLEVRMQSGRPYLTCRDATRRRTLSARSSAIARAYRSGEREVGVEVPLPTLRYNAFRCEAQAFGAGERRFVLSVVTPVELT